MFGIHFGFWIADFGSKTRIVSFPPIQNPKSAIQNCYMQLPCFQSAISDNQLAIPPNILYPPTNRLPKPMPPDPQLNLLDVNVSQPTDPAPDPLTTEPPKIQGYQIL